MGDDIGGLHHVGLVAADMSAAVETYRRLGFTVPPPACPALPAAPGALARPVGAANTHVYLRRNFVEIVTPVGDGQPLPDDSRTIPIEVPDDRLPGLLAAVRGAAANLAACLDRFPGLHILIFDSPDIDRAARRLDAVGVGHGGVHAIQRPIETGDGTRMVPARYLEFDGDVPGAPSGRLPEGRLGIAENAPVDGEQRPTHANGAVDLVGCTLCVADDELPEAARRYETYLGRAARRAGPTATFDLDDATLTLVAASAVPGGPPALPGFAGYTIAVRDLTQTEDHLRAAGVPHARPRAGEIAVPASAALGATIAFRSQAH
ncbi:Glyoxalase-like domain-containing protein [Micromonospora citrea]|uniref:Glyoxalase-like domain-containing protein n=1 Tax=Micromonospora citrea TaxID=47855 RepID=A0A1C6U5M2_9ACTN|nr:VOC family protein [Micromonospora citrea]SCL49284.1 Glyoxalase-like domain-containing protein [Micromonospora citrea]